MIQQVTGNIFDIDADILVNTVNCFGVMGCGIALAFKKRYPYMFSEYKNRCRRNQMVPGVLWTYEEDGKTIINFPTKNHWKNPSKYEYIDSGLRELRQFLIDYKPKTMIRKGSVIWVPRSVPIVALPAIGCGHGGLDWDTVFPMIENYLGDLENVKICLFQPV